MLCECVCVSVCVRVCVCTHVLFEVGDHDPEQEEEGQECENKLES